MDAKKSLHGNVSALPELATVKEWAEAFGVTPRTVYTMCSENRVKTVRIRNRIRIVRDESLAMLGL